MFLCDVLHLRRLWNLYSNIIMYDYDLINIGWYKFWIAYKIVILSSSSFLCMMSCSQPILNQSSFWIEIQIWDVFWIICFILIGIWREQIFWSNWSHVIKKKKLELIDSDEILHSPFISVLEMTNICHMFRKNIVSAGITFFLTTILVGFFLICLVEEMFLLNINALYKLDAFLSSKS